jgi:HD-GYP domain-containing protein (c-di-GMP phosphodiesterase class II)
MDRNERTVLGASAILYALAAVSIAAFLPSERAADPVLIAGLVLGYAAASRVRFEFGSYYVVPEQLVYVPMLLLVPLPLVPVLVAGAAALAHIPDVARGPWARDRWLGPLADSWPLLTPVLVLAAFAPGPIQLASAGIYLLALFAQMGTDFAQTFLRDRLLDHLPLRDVAEHFAGTAWVDVVLSPIAFVIALAGYDQQLLLLATIPGLVWLLAHFSKDRRERYASALELNRAYRGTVMLLSDVLECDDQYTAHHSRSVVDLVNAVADELGIDAETRQEVEFAAMLHDIGKIAIPKEILHKPAALTDEEFGIIKTHTIEGQFMLDRVGGLLARVGEIVRSCHERWDGRGYPDGLMGEEIPPTARIVFACDAYNAMTTDRPYRPGMAPEEAIAELHANAATQFDPAVVVALTKVIAKGEPILPLADGVRAVLANQPLRHGIGAAS